jgi:hypothetical protein
MPYQLLKGKLLDIYRWEILPRIEALHAEQIYQGIFAQQCARLGLQEPFYPVGAAASYSLMYLLTRILGELPIRHIVEMGSGQSTVLIDRLRAEDGSHVAYEQNPQWAATVSARAPRCAVRHSALRPTTFEGVSYDGYGDLQCIDFDLLLVDGPNGTDHHSRFDCVPLVAANRSREFIVIVDDAGRPGEQETLEQLVRVLNRREIAHKVNYLSGRTTQAVITTEGMRAASYFY